MARSKNSGTRITIVFMLLAFSVVTYVVAPLFLPVWAWFNLDWQHLSAQFDTPIAELQTEYQAVLRYRKRGQGDPSPWQIVQMREVKDPHGEWPQADEFMVAVRINLVNDRTGDPPSTLTIGSTFRDHFYTATIYRFPAGAFGIEGPRPVVVYKGDSFEKMSLTEARAWDEEVRQKWAEDEYWEGRADNWIEAAQEAQAAAEEAAGEEPAATTDGSGQILPGQ